jgi:hypothetical protein
MNNLEKTLQFLLLIITFRCKTITNMNNIDSCFNF